MSMTSFHAGWMAAIVCCCTLAAQESAHLDGIKQVYVEPFAVKKSSNKLREDVIAQLRKLSSIKVVSSASNADAVLTGEGEIWVKGYVSLNPRSGRLPSDGTPIYSGFISVELKDRKGDTLWSYLITPGTTSGDICKEFAKQIEKYLAEALEGRTPRL